MSSFVVVAVNTRTATELSKCFSLHFFSSFVTHPSGGFQMTFLGDDYQLCDDKSGREIVIRQRSFQRVAQTHTIVMFFKIVSELRKSSHFTFYYTA